MTHHESGAAAESVIGQATQSVFADLIERLEKATGPSFELDEAIWCALNPDHDPTTYNGDPRWKAYTQSIDAALTLIPTEWMWTLDFDKFSGRSKICAACIWPTNRDGPTEVGDSDTLAIALCIAALKARAA